MKAIIQLSQELIAFSLLGDGLNISINGQPVEFELVTDSLEEPIKVVEEDIDLSGDVWIDTSNLDVLEFRPVWRKLSGIITNYNYNYIVRNRHGWFRTDDYHNISGTQISIEQALAL
tara:strand:+ start:253 stop:603 length:351 start_codon:yes stop_codon:yes gene_type:complete